MNADRWRKDKDPNRPTKQSLFYRLVSPGKHTESRRTDRPRRPEPEKRVLQGLCENPQPPPATAPVRLAGSCLAHRAQQTAKVGFRNVRAHPHQRSAKLDLNSLRLCRMRVHQRLALDPLCPQSGSATPREKLRRRDIQRTRQRRDIRAWLQRRCDCSVLEVVRPAPAFADRCPIETFGSDLYELVRVSSAVSLRRDAPCGKRGYRDASQLNRLYERG